MSLNLRCSLLANGKEEEVPLFQTPTAVTLQILGNGQPWQEVAKRYLDWTATQDVDVYRQARRTIGRAWKQADDASGRLVFRVV